MAHANGKLQTLCEVLEPTTENQVAEACKSDGVGLFILDCRGAA
jgi:hypothetical protein